MYRVLVPGQQHFVCLPLHATIDTKSCAERWLGAPQGTQCRTCETGQSHAQQHRPQTLLPVLPRRTVDGFCLRCGRTDLRLVSAKTLCVSCFNRALEWRKGRNSRGTPPKHYKPLSTFQLAVRLPGGRVEHRRIEAKHAAEAACLVSHALEADEKFAVGNDAIPGRDSWNKTAGHFVYRCSRCKGPGLMELVLNNGVVLYRCPSCDGKPQGGDWSLAQARKSLQAMTPDDLVRWLKISEPQNPEQTRWSASEFICAACWRSPLIEHNGSAGRVCECPACGSVSRNG